jgi:hypothetical protein
MDLQEITNDSPCTIKLLESAQNTTNCKQIEVKMSQPIFMQFETANLWVFILPKEIILKLKCHNQEESRKLFGSFLLKIPNSCEITTNKKKIVTNQKNVSRTSQPVLFPDINTEINLLPTLNLSVQLQRVNLDELHEIQNEIQNNQPHLFFEEISKVPSLWTIIIYASIILCLAVYCYKKYFPRSKISKQPTQAKEELDLKDVQLPR